LPEIRNPNLQGQGPGGGGGGGDMRSMMGFALLLLVVLMGYQYFFKPKTTPETIPQTQTQTQPAQSATNSTPAIATPAGAATTQTAAASTPTVAAALETDITVENELYKIVFTNRGALVKHWILKKYNEASGKPLDLVQTQTAAQFGLPLSLFTYEPALTSQLNQGLYQLTVSGAQPSGTGTVLAPATLAFHYAANGVDVVKTFSFEAGYVISIETHVLRNGAPMRALVEWPAGLGDMDEFAPTTVSRGGIPASAGSSFAWALDGKTDTTKAKSVSGNDTLNGPYQYAGITDLYFAAAFIPDNPSDASVVTLHGAMQLPGTSTSITGQSQTKMGDVIGVAVGDTNGFTRLHLYAGPKQLDVLKTIHTVGADGSDSGPTLESLIHYGWLGIVAKPLYIALRFLHGLLGTGSYNWGWSIIIFTAAFNFIMMPARIYMMKTSLKTMRIQPKVDAIKRKYANLKVSDPKRAEMNAEIMALHQSEGINMVGGCLPLLIQMPLFIAYFEVLSNVIELRQAHWFWLRDLSSPDPIHLLPIVIIVSMFITQIITPSPGMERNQRFIMAFLMPIMMGSFLWSYASGLALYWCTSNLIGLSTQLILNQSSMGKEMHAIALKRQQRKNGGGGGPKTIQGRK
jgi:YidC/Oxa1 family membrane protein insertase